MPATSANWPPAFTPPLVFVSGPLKAAPLHDPEVDLTTPGLRLVRTVHIWQWIQQIHDITQTNPTTHKMEHVRTEYSYYQGWSEKALDSSKPRPGFRRPPTSSPANFRWALINYHRS